MQNQKPLVLLLFLISIAITVSAQDFRPGYIVKNNGDRIEGLVDNRSAKMNTASCYFKPSREEKSIEYIAGEILGFGITDDRYYEAKQIKEGSSNKTVFFEVLVNGKLSLFRYRDLFYLKNDTLFALPRNVEKKITNDYVDYSMPSNRYIGILNYLMADCHLSANQTRYEERGLTRLVQNYNRCKGEQGITYKSKKAWTKFSPFIFSGYDQSKLNEFKGYSFGKSISSFVGIGFDLSAPRVNDKFFFTMEMWYLKKFYQGYSQYIDGSGGLNRSDAFINAPFLKVPLSIRFNLLSESRTPYVRIGYVQYFALSAPSSTITETAYGNVVSTARQNLPYDKSIQGMMLGLGYQQKINARASGFFEARIEENNGFLAAPGTGLSGTVLNLLLGIKF